MTESSLFRRLFGSRPGPAEPDPRSTHREPAHREPTHREPAPREPVLGKQAPQARRPDWERPNQDGSNQDAMVPQRVRSRTAGGAPAREERAPQRLVSPGIAFTPTQPKTGRRRLVGRQEELKRILQALQEDRGHVVLYSERGRGKTSLANLVVEQLHRAGIAVARHTCEAGTTFDSLMHGLMRALPPSLLAARASGQWASGAPRGYDQAAYGDASYGDPSYGNVPDDTDFGEGCEAALPPGPLTPRDVVELPRRLACRELVCVVDEFDRIADATARTRLADTIKQLSDRDVRLRFLIVGVSENLDEILGQHPSIQRAVIGVHLPLFTDRDVAQLIVRGGRETGLVFLPPAIARITVLARGMPYMAQLLGLRLAQAAAERGDPQVSEQDFDTAVVRLVQDARPHVLRLYAQLTNHGRDAAMVLALRRIATAPQDPWGRLQVMPFQGSSLQGGASAEGAVVVGGRVITRECWERLEAAAVLQSQTPGSGLYVFAERALMHHTLLLAAREVALPSVSGTTASDAFLEASQDAFRDAPARDPSGRDPSGRDPSGRDPSGGVRAQAPSVAPSNVSAWETQARRRGARSGPLGETV